MVASIICINAIAASGLLGAISCAATACTAMTLMPCVTPTGRHDLVLSGASSFRPNNDTVGATLMQMDTAESGELFGIDGLTGVRELALLRTIGADPKQIRRSLLA
ncbi:MAG: hypothetical protein ACI8V4_003286 [Ilumatobacter sp.]|jgi:hypothetical protein